MTPYLEIGGDYREVLPGIHVLELPLPFSLGLINAYLVRLEDGWMLVDTGMDTESCFEALNRAREGLGIGWPDIRRILLTHIHPDHMGLASRLLGLTGARLSLHSADERLLAEVSDLEGYRAWNETVLVRAGVDPPMIEHIAASLVAIHRSFHRLRADIPLAGGETFATPWGPLEVVWTPGHSPGHVCLYQPARRLLLSGDHILEHISPNIGWQPGRDALGEFLDSLDRIAALDVHLILPSHGAPFRGHREWVVQTRRHHQERCDRLLAFADRNSKPAAAFLEALWDRPLSPFHFRFAVFEVLAHMEYLERRGAVRRCPREGVEYWSRA